MTHPDTDVAEVVDAPASLNGQAAEDAFAEILAADSADVEDGNDVEIEQESESDGDEPELDDSEEEDGDDPESPAIEPPSSLTKEEKEAFAQLPVELQQSVAAIEARRNADVTKAQQAAAEAQRDAKAHAANEQADTYHTFASDLIETVAGLIPQMPPAYLLRQDEALYREMEEAHHAAMAEAQPFVAMAQKAQEQAQAARNAWQDQQTKIVAQIPGWNDPVKREAILGAVGQIADELELAPETVAGISADAFKALLQASEWKAERDALKAKLEVFEGKRMERVRSFKGKPITSKPGAAISKDSREAGKASAAISQLSANPNSRDAAEAAFRALGL